MITYSQNKILRKTKFNETLISPIDTIKEQYEITIFPFGSAF